MRTNIFLYLFLFTVILQAQENPWGISKPNEIKNLAWERYYIEGFAWPTSVLPGEDVRIYVSVKAYNDSQAYNVTFYRCDGSQVGNTLQRTGEFFPLHDKDGNLIYPGNYSKKPVEYKVGCRGYWESGSFTINTSNWKSGLYYAKLEHLSIPSSDTLAYEEKYYYVPFVVRSPNPGANSKILLKFELTTWQAYNYWGGGSLYSSTQDSSLETTDTIAIDRPIRLDYVKSLPWYLKSFEELLRDSNYVIEYCDNIDLNKSESGFGIDLLSKYKLLILFNHDEYWSRKERKNIEAFKGSIYHGNIARFSANTCYWEIFWNEDYTKFKCRKADNQDLWRLDTELGPEAKFLGSQYDTSYNVYQMGKDYEEPPAICVKPGHWIFRGTGLTNQDSMFGFWKIVEDTIDHKNDTLGILCGELDNMNKYPPPYADNLIRDTLAQRYVSSYDTDTTKVLQILHQMIYYEDTVSNSRGFAFGAMGWTRGIDDIVLEPHKNRMKIITMNIIDHFTERKFRGKIYISSDSTHPWIWNSNIEIDGDVELLPNKYLQILSSTITLDSLITFFIDGTLEIVGNVNITSQHYSQINLWHNGKIKLKAGSTLTLGGNVLLDIEDNGDVIFENQSKLVINGTVYAYNGVNFTVETGGTLEMRPASQFLFQEDAKLTVYGKLTDNRNDNQKKYSRMVYKTE